MRQEITFKQQGTGQDSWTIKIFEDTSSPKRTVKTTVENGLTHNVYTVFLDKDKNPVMEIIEICISTEIVFEDPNIAKKNQLIESIKAMNPDDVAELKELLK